MRGVNKVILVGFVGKDPEVQRFEGGNMVTRFSLATTEYYKDKSGNRAEQTEWHNISVWGKQAETAEKYVKKGSALYVEGRIRSRDYTDKNGVQRRAFDIICDRFNMLDRKPESASGAMSPGNTSGIDVPPEDAMVDDLPF